MKKRTILFVEFLHITAGRHLLPILAALKNQPNVDINLLAERDSFLSTQAKLLDINVHETAFIEFNVHNLGTYIPTIKLLIFMYRICLKYKVDIIHVHRLNWAYLAIITSTLLRLVVFVDIVIIENICSKIQRNLFFYYKKCFFVAVSKSAKQEFCLLYNISSARIFVYFGGIEQFKGKNTYNSNKSADHILLKLKAYQKKKTRIVAMISRVDPRKGVDVFIDAASMLLKNHNDVVFIHFGKNHRYSFGENYNDTGKSYEEICLLKTRKMNLEHRFFMYDYTDAILKYYPYFFCTVLPSWKETLGYVLLESMVAKKPVIGSSVGGIPEIMDNGRAGILIPFPPSSVDLANAVDLLLRDKSIYQSLSKIGYNRVIHKFNPTLNINELLGYYECTLQKL